MQVRWRAISQTFLGGRVQVCCCDNMRGRWVQTLVSKTWDSHCTGQDHSWPHIAPVSKVKSDLQKKFKYHINSEQTNSLWVQTWSASVLNVSGKISSHQSASHHWQPLGPKLPDQYKPYDISGWLTLWRQGSNVNWFHTEWSYLPRDGLSATQIGQGDSLSGGDFWSMLLIPVLFI